MKILILLLMLSPPSYFTKSIHPSGKREDTKLGYIKRYYNNRQRFQSRIFFRKGIMVDWLGRPIDTFRDIRSDVGGLDIRNYCKFVLSKDMSLYINREDKQVKHSQFTGDDVADAGWLQIKEGRLIQIYHDSGHYRPDALNLMQLIIELFNQGLDYLDISMNWNDLLGYHKVFILNRGMTRNLENMFYISEIRNIYQAA